MLQAGKPLPVWGTAEPGVQVTVTVQGRRASAVSNANGCWSVTLPPLTVSPTERMILSAGTEELVYQDAAVGEVWLCGGQSNMELPMEYDAEYASEKAACADPLLRFYDCPERSCPEDDERDYADFGLWRICSEEDLRYFSAVGYYFAKTVRARGVPVGIIGCNWGGTKVTSWMPEEITQQCGGKDLLERFQKALEGLDVPALTARYRADPAADRSRMFAAPRCLGEFLPVPRETQLDLLQTLPQAEPMPVLPCAPQWPGVLYRHMLAPVAPYALRGFLYYQGESDADDANLYASLFAGLIRCWRTLWGEELPFLAVQLAPFEQWFTCSGAHYETIRAAQAQVADTVPGVFLASIGDVGEQYDIHPKHKRPVGQRLGWLARRHVYGEDIPADAPRLAGAVREGDRVTFTFSEVKHWTGDQNTDCLTVTAGGSSVPFSAEVSGNTLVLTLPPKTGAITVRYAWTPWYRVALFNESGLPLLPFSAEIESFIKP